jgi:hypothetical protein
MLQPDSLVLDLVFRRDEPPQPEALLEALGGEEEASKRQLFDPDAHDPRIEMQLSPTIPFRRRGERRLMIIDDSVAPMRHDRRTDPIVPLDLSAAKERIIALVETTGARLGRVFALGTWGDAVLVARSAVDLRAISLVGWVLDPQLDVDGKRRAAQPTQKDIEDKIAAYDRRLEELDEKQILADIGPAKLERRGELLVLDVLEPDGTWDIRKSFAMEQALAAIDRFSRIPGAPAAGMRTAPPASKPATKPAPAKAAPPRAPSGPPLRAGTRKDRVVLVFPPERWDLDIAAAMGKRDWDLVVRSSDPLSGDLRDRIYRDGAGFVAPLEFLSEVFVDGKPLSRPEFDQHATDAGGGVRTLPVHCPRYGAALLIATPDRGRFITSELDAGPAILELLAG